MRGCTLIVLLLLASSPIHGARGRKISEPLQHAGVSALGGVTDASERAVDAARQVVAASRTPGQLQKLDSGVFDDVERSELLRQLKEAYPELERLLENPDEVLSDLGLHRLDPSNKVGAKELLEKMRNLQRLMGLLEELGRILPADKFPRLKAIGELSDKVQQLDQLIKAFEQLGEDKFASTFGI